MAIMRPDVVFFGESALEIGVADQMEMDDELIDMIIVIGSTLSEEPFAHIPREFQQELVIIIIVWLRVSAQLSHHITSTVPSVMLVRHKVEEKSFKHSCVNVPPKLSS